jgi:predicted tellurium resistance membrane protein TerC
MALGLAISIPVVVFGSVMMLGIMARFPVVIAGGAMLLGWIAGEIMVEDRAIAHWIGSHALWLRHWHVASIAGALLVIGLGKHRSPGNIAEQEK